MPRTRAALLGAASSARGEGHGVIMATHHRDEWPANVSHEIELERGRAVYGGPVRGRSVR